MALALYALAVLRPALTRLFRDVGNALPGCSGCGLKELLSFAIVRRNDECPFRAVARCDTIATLQTDLSEQQRSLRLSPVRFSGP